MSESSGGGGLWNIAWHLACELSNLGVELVLQTSTGYYRKDKHHQPFRIVNNLVPADGSGWHLRIKPLWALDRFFRFNWNGFLRERLVRRENFRLAHIQLIIPEVDWLWIPRLARLAPVICTIHDVLPHSEGPILSPLRKWFQTRILHAASHLIVHTQANKAQLIEIFRVDPARIHVIPFGITPDGFNGTQIEARRQINLPIDRPNILFLGNIRDDKGLDILLTAMHYVKGMLPSALLVIAGALPLHTSFLAYERLIHDLGIEDNVATHLGWVDEKDISAYYSAANVVVLPYTKFLSQSAVLLWAYPHSRPVIVSNVGALGETVLRDGTGLVVPPGDPVVLAEAIIRLLSDPDMVGDFANAMQRCISTSYNWANIARATLELYGECVTHADEVAPKH